VKIENFAVFRFLFQSGNVLLATRNVAFVWCRKRASGLPQLDTGGEESSHDRKKKLWLQGLQYGSRADCYFALFISLGG
jgi:hypothetical protein